MAATIAITTKHNPLAFLLYMTKVNLTIDGQTTQAKWGTQAMSVEPGPHNVEVSFRYFGRDCGKASTQVNAAEGTTTSIAYKAPQVVTRPGKISVG